MKALLLPPSSTASLLRILREHFIDESTRTFIFNICRITGLQLTERDAAQLQFQICKIFLDNLYRYLSENRLHEFIQHQAYNQIGMALYINPIYATETLKPLYENMVSLEDQDQLERDLVQVLMSRINHIYSIDSQRFNQTLAEILEVFINLIPTNVKVLRFEFAPNLSPMVCYTTEEDMMQCLYA